MNHHFIRFLIGRLVMILGLLMIPSLIVTLIYQNNWQIIQAFLYSILICEIGGYIISVRKPVNTLFLAQEGLALVALSWFILSVFGAFPFYLSGAVPSFVDALFESVSTQIMRS